MSNEDDATESAQLAIELAVAMVNPIRKSMRRGSGDLQTKHTHALGIAVGACYRAIVGPGPELDASVWRVILKSIESGAGQIELATLVRMLADQRDSQ